MHPTSTRVATLPFILRPALTPNATAAATKAEKSRKVSS